MSPRRILAAVFAAASLTLVTMAPVPSASTAPLLAQTADCGAYSGNLCKQTTSCMWNFFGRICTTYYYYYPSQDDGDGGADTPEESPS
jgi:hypothetical protein